jgi:xylose isomerase
MDGFVKSRYASFDHGMGAKVEARSTSLDELDAYAQSIAAPVLESGRQEMLENLFNAQVIG